MSNSNSIYHYVYRITNIITCKHYYGKRTCRCLPQNDIGHKYFSSSHDRGFMLEQKQHPERFKYKVIAHFKNSKSALDFEIKLHSKFNVAANQSFYNRANQSSTKFDTTGYVTVKDKDGNTFNVDVNNPEYLSGKLKHIRFGHLPCKDAHGNTFSACTDDPRFLSGEITTTMSGHVVAKDKHGNIHVVSKSNPLYLSGKLCGVTKGQITVKDKHGNTLSISTHDPEYLSGNLTSLFSGKTHSSQSKTKIGAANSKAQKGERNSQYGTMWIYNIDTFESTRVNKTDEIPNGWARGRKMNRRQ